ncbi:hypothetical protein AMATHDRAFT_485 [Amanita thiersii Skay4041]|uniref:Small ribosomal subunit protein uS13m n=1 Tax=Amanita thiersii Skay4041 TaxID=703135 RepID=A0A2A9NXI7_9AGAR|nr:hypothetical protein AMATHDRAFT_485 [Amanita thiersii Skay4041]
MVHILGVNLRDTHRVWFALTSFYGIGRVTAHRICARLQVHDTCRIKNLTPHQLTALTSYLSSPETTPTPPRYPLATSDYVAPQMKPAQELQAEFHASRARREEKNKQKLDKAFPIKGDKYLDPLKNVKIESELRRQIRENIAHQRMIGSYVGRRHAMHLPVRGQNTRSNAKTARKLNQLDRY